MAIEFDGNSIEKMDDITKEVRNMYTRYSYPGFGEGEKDREKSVNIFINAFRNYQTDFEGKKILDVGCGTGYTTACLAKNLPQCQVFGVDISPGSLEVAEEYKSRLKLDNLTLRELDVTKQDIPQESFIFALASGSLHHMSEPEKALRNITSSLEHGGILGLSVYSSANNMQRYRMRDALDCLVPDRSEVETRNQIARELWPEARKLPPQELADSLSHPCDRSYYFREIHDLSINSGLEFLEWCNCATSGFAKSGKEMGRHFEKLDMLQKHELIELLASFKLINLFFKRP